MEDPKNTWNPQGKKEKKKPALKIGPGGGIGAVFLLGGALATAAFVSLFVVRKKGKIHPRKPESQPETKEGNVEKEEQRLIVVDEASIVYEHRSSEGVEVGDDSALIDCLKEDVKQSDDEAIKENFVPEMEEKDEKLPSEDMIPEAVSYEGLNEVCGDEKETELITVDDFVEGVVDDQIENRSVNVGELVGINGEMKEEQCEELIDDDIGNELVNDVICGKDEAIETIDSVPELVFEYVQETPLPAVIHNPVVEMETVNGDAKEHEDVKEGAPCGETVHETSLPVIDTPVVEVEIVNGDVKEGASCGETVQEDEDVHETPSLVIDTPVVEVETVNDDDEKEDAPCGETMHETPLPVIDTPVVEVEIVNGDTKEGASCGETVQADEDVHETPSPVVETENDNVKEGVPCSETTQAYEEDVQEIDDPLGEVEITNVDAKEGAPCSEMSQEYEDVQETPLPVIVAAPAVETDTVNGDAKEGVPCSETIQEYEDVQETPSPVIDTPVVQVETVNGDAHEGVPFSETAQEYEDVQETPLPVIDAPVVEVETVNGDSEIKVVEELVEEHQTCELVGETDETNFESDNKQENDCFDAGTEEVVENLEANDDDNSETSLQSAISQQAMEEVTKQDKPNEDLIDGNIETSSHSTIPQPTDTEDNLHAIKEAAKQDIDKVEHSSQDIPATETSEEEDDEESADSKSIEEAEKLNLVDREVEGKALEDAPVKGYEKSGDSLAYYNQYSDKKETFIMQQVVAMAKANATNPVRRAVAIGTISTLSCSWFFGLSLVRLCAIVFLTMILSKIQGY